MSFPARLEIPEDVLEIARRLDAAGHEVWCVGGAIRDALAGARGTAVEPSDVDFATSATPEEVQRLFRRTVPVGVKHGTVGVLDRRRALHEVTTFRRDVTTDGRHAVVAYGVSLDEDLARRDFTINAIAYHPLRHEWRDPFGGADDLAHGVVRAVGDPAARFREDYLRILRALRFAARFEFRIDPATWEGARAAAPGLAQLSAERVRDEWFKGLESARSVARLVELWQDVGAAAVWLPELGATGRYSEPEADRPPRDPLLLTVLFCAQPGTVLRRLRASNAEVARAEAMARGPEAPADATPEAARRWLARVQGAADDLLALWRLRHGAEPPWASVVAGVRARGEPTVRGDLALDGNDLVALGLPRGPRIGEILDRLLDRVLADPSLNTPERLAELVRTWLRELG
ncbi:MAG TPA: CCA tRNA nucleotidyltransferase [Gemmatimonadales bacterium]|nr:CCA tRNA nucleotidyltransferase [Gemmatimonadales bacterium]